MGVYENNVMEQEIIGNKYRLIKKLGEGGGGRVYLAEDFQLGTFWAIKEVKERQLFEREVETLRSIRHKNLPLLIDVIKQEKKAYLVMEYIEGRTLQEILDKKKTLSLKEGIRIGIEILEALECLHNQKPAVVYGDIKLSNIMIDKEGKVKLIDFGTSLDANGREISYGTIGYAAPEQVLMNLYDPGIDTRTDIYCFGILLYKMLTGEYPRNEEGMKKMQHPNLSESMKRLLSRCLAFEKGKRYEKVEYIIEDLKKMSEEEKRKKRKKQAADSMFLILFILSICCFVLYSCQWQMLLYPSALFWLLAFLWYKVFGGKKEEFYQGDGVRLFLSEKKISGLFLLCLGISCLILTWNLLLLVENMNVEASGKKEQILQDEFGRKVLIRETK